MNKRFEHEWDQCEKDDVGGVMELRERDGWELITVLCMTYWHLFWKRPV